MIEIESNSGAIWGVFGLLLAFGTLYNALVAWAERKGYTEGYMSLVVALGVGVTLGGVSILSIEAAVLTLICFIASGAPMIVGSIVRYLKKREAARQVLLAEVEK